MVSFARRLRAENSKKFTAHIYTAAVLFTRTNWYTRNSNIDQYCARIVPEIRKSWPAQLSIGDSVHFLGTIYGSTIVLIADHTVRAVRNIHLRRPSAVVRLGSRANCFQCCCRSHTISRSNDINGCETVSHTSCCHGTECRPICMLYHTCFSGECFFLRLLKTFSDHIRYQLNS